MDSFYFLLTLLCGLVCGIIFSSVLFQKYNRRKEKNRGELKRNKKGVYRIKNGTSQNYANANDTNDFIDTLNGSAKRGSELLYTCQWENDLGEQSKTIRDICCEASQNGN